MRPRVQKKMMRKRVKGKKRVKKRKKQASFYAKASDVKSAFLYKPTYICTLVQRGMF